MINKMKKIIAFSVISAMVASCTPINKNNTYNATEVGQNTTVSFGKIISVREVEINAENAGGGALLGGGAGGLAGSAIGSGRGQTTAIVAGALIGAVAGAIAENELKHQQGVEYIVRYESLNLAKSVVQTLEKGDKMISVGSCVMVQQRGNYQRVLPATDAKLCKLEDDSTTRRTKSVTKVKNKVVKSPNEETEQEYTN